MRVPLSDPVREVRELRAEIDSAISGVVDSGRYVLGEVVERFEDAVAAHIGVGHAVGVANGTDALRIALEALGIGPGDEVITSPFTFIGTAGSIVHVGATPVFADIEPDTFNLDPRAVEAAIGPATAAVVPVHLFGQMADMGAFREIAARHGLALVEDAAQAIGASQERGDGELRAGAASDTGCFSFYPTKNLSALGDAGLVTADDPALAERVRRLRDHGRRAGTVDHTEPGHNSRLDALQAAVLSVKLPRLDMWTERRRGHAAAYDEALAEVPGVEAPVTREGNRHVFHQYTVRCEDRAGWGRRLEAGGVAHGIYYAAPLHRLTAFGGPGPDASAAGEEPFPEAARASREVLSIPVFAHLEEAERERVIGVLQAARRAGTGDPPGPFQKRPRGRRRP